MSNTTIREATLQDLEPIVALLCDDTLGATREDANNMPAYKAAFGAIAADPNQVVLVMEKDLQIIGCVQISYLPTLALQGSLRAELEGVRIHRNYRGTGLGKQLIQEAIRQAKLRGCKIVQLTTNMARHDAIAFYKSLGFQGSHLGMKVYI